MLSASVYRRKRVGVVTRKSKEKTMARAIQEDTGWKYQACVNLLRNHSPEEVDVIVAKERAKRQAKETKGEPTTD